jgi:hypothetical protein
MEQKKETIGKAPKIPEKVLGQIEAKALHGIEDFDHFELDGIPFLTFKSPQKNQDGSVNGSPAVYVSHPEGWGIYVWEGLPEKVESVLFFHEIIEVYQRVKFKMDQVAAHNAALSYEEVFIKKFLSAEERVQAERLRSEGQK